MHISKPNTMLYFGNLENGSAVTFMYKIFWLFRVNSNHTYFNSDAGLYCKRVFFLVHIKVWPWRDSSAFNCQGPGSLWPRTLTPVKSFKELIPPFKPYTCVSVMWLLNIISVIIYQFLQKRKSPQNTSLVCSTCGCLSVCVYVWVWTSWHAWKSSVWEWNESRIGRAVLQSWLFTDLWLRVDLESSQQKNKTKTKQTVHFLQIGSKTHQTVVDPTTAVTTVLSRINVAARTAPREQEEKNSSKINGVLVFCRSVGDIWTQNASLVIFLFSSSLNKGLEFTIHISFVLPKLNSFSGRITPSQRLARSGNTLWGDKPWK